MPKRMRFDNGHELIYANGVLSAKVLWKTHSWLEPGNQCEQLVAVLK